MALQLTDSNFKETVLDNEGITLVDFWAQWCGPCRAIGPVIEELHATYEGKAQIGKVDVDDNPELSQKYGIRSIPTLLIMKGGEVVDTIVGAPSKQTLVDKLEAQLQPA
jgi:thioredoxin 1